MLNPKAVEFKPRPLEYGNDQPSHQQQSQPKQRFSGQQPQTKQANVVDPAIPTPKKKSESPALSGSNIKGRRRQQPQSSQQQQQQQQQHQQQRDKPTAAGQKKSRRGSSQQAQPSARRESHHEALIPAALFDQPAKFITIEGVIDPVDHIGTKGQGERRLTHGYERYIEWIGRSLKTFETVTIVGMDYAIADVISLVTIVQQRGIGEHEEVETFSLQQSSKRYTSGIQVKLHCV